MKGTGKVDRQKDKNNSYCPLCFTRPLLKHRILVKARLEESVLMDMQKLQDEGEQCSSFMWHRVALCAGSITQQLNCYQKCITSLLVIPLFWHHYTITSLPKHDTSAE